MITNSRLNYFTISVNMKNFHRNFGYVFMQIISKMSSQLQAKVLNRTLPFRGGGGLSVHIYR